MGVAIAAARTCIGLHARAVRAAPVATAGSSADSARPELHCLESARPCCDALTARVDCRQPADLGWTSARNAGDVRGHRRRPRGVRAVLAYSGLRSPGVRAAADTRAESRLAQLAAALPRGVQAVPSQQLGHRLDRALAC